MGHCFARGHYQNGYGTNQFAKWEKSQEVDGTHACVQKGVGGPRLLQVKARPQFAARLMEHPPKTPCNSEFFEGRPWPTITVSAATPVAMLPPYYREGHGNRADRGEIRFPPWSSLVPHAGIIHRREHPSPR